MRGEHGRTVIIFLIFHVIIKKLNFSENIFTTVLTLVFEIFVLITKFFIALIDAIYTAFTTVERDVSGDIVLITGSGHGIGKELALQYAALGATIVCWDINEQLNTETVDLIKTLGGKASGYT